MPRCLNAIRSIRLGRKPSLKQRDLAELLGCSQGDVANYELGRVVPDLARAFDIAHALGVDLEEVFYDTYTESVARVRRRRAR